MASIFFSHFSKSHFPPKAAKYRGGIFFFLRMVYFHLAFYREGGKKRHRAQNDRTNGDCGNRTRASKVSDIWSHEP